MREKIFKASFLTLYITVSVLLFACYNHASAADNKQDNYILKSIYIHNFVKLITFPHAEKTKHLSFCTIGEDPFASSIDQVAEKSPINVTLLIKRGVSLPEIKKCDMLFISRSEQKTLARILAKLNNAPTLTISEINQFAEKGGMIQFIDTEEGKVKLAINLGAAKNAHIKIDPLLLEVAIDVFL